MINEEKFSFYDKQVIIKSKTGVSKSTKDIVNNELFKVVIKKYIKSLENRNSPLLAVFPDNLTSVEKINNIIDIISELTSNSIDSLSVENRNKILTKDRYLFSEFIEKLYDHWRNYERFFIYYSNDENKEDSISPYRTFSETIEQLNYFVRKLYRNVISNITGEHFKIYRQIPAACQVGLIVEKQESKLFNTPEYESMKDINFIKQVLIEPPLIIDPPNNTRNGSFLKVDTNPLEKLEFNTKDWLCYPAKVGDLIIHLFFHNKYIGLGTAVANLFDLADDKDLNKKPDAIYAYGVKDEVLKNYDSKTVFYDDKKNDVLVAAVPRGDEFGYFGYIKKMMLTLHNIVMMKRKRLPVHGAMVNVCLKNGTSSNIIIWGDTGAGKSESLEAFRTLSQKYLRDMKIIFDDMGTLEISDDIIKGYGTETGAFVRLDDLSPGYAFGNIDRSIIMSPQKVNARAVLPITTMHEVLKGYAVDYILYANNYEQVDEEHPIYELFHNKDEAQTIFKKGARMAKGTTTETGLVYTYYSNIFGPKQYQEIHDKLADKYFEAMFNSKVKVGMIRTRLGIKGYETKGPEEVAKALFEMISE